MRKNIILLIITFFFCGVIEIQAQEEKVTPYFTPEEMPDLIKCLPAPPDTVGTDFGNDIMRYMWGKAQRNDPQRAAFVFRDAVWNYDSLFAVFSVPFGLEISKQGTPEIYKFLITSQVFLDQLEKARKEYQRLTGKMAPEADASQFVNITDIIPDAILEIRYYSTYNFVGTRVDGYLEPIALMTKQAADSLKAVSDDLKQQGYRLKIYDAYRPQCAVDHFLRWGADINDTLMKPYFYPEIPRDKLFDLGYIARRSGHSRGSTVDLTLFDMNTEKEVDMGGTFDWFGVRSHPDFGGNPNTGKYKPNDQITAEQFHNRMILRQAMLRHGFKPYDEEWWHFTLKNEPFPDTYFTFPVKTLH